jgi:hypothetical protein
MTARLHPVAAVAPALLALVIVVGGPTPEAFGHAAGPVPEARLSSRGPVVEVRWSAAPDDTAAIGAIIGAFPRSVSYAYLEGATEGLPSAREIAAFSGSPELRDYLLQHVAIEQDGTPCRGQVEPTEDFIGEGARLLFSCPRPVEQASVTVTILHDDDPTYRTFSVDGTEQFAMHTIAAPTHEWDFTASGGARSLPLSFLIGAILLVGGAAASLRLLGPGRRRAPSTVDA